MENKEIIIGGIDRHSPAQDAQLGVCEELINVRNDLLGLHLYKQGEFISSNLNFTNIHIHSFNGVDYYIGITPEGEVVCFDLDGHKKQGLQWVSSAGETDIKSIGNMLVVSDKGGESGVPKTTVYVLKLEGEEIVYKQLNPDELPLPTIPRDSIYLKPFRALGSSYSQNIEIIRPAPSMGITEERHIFPFFYYIPEGVQFNQEFKQSVKATLQSAIGRVLSLDRHLCHGYVLIGTTVTLYDGTETGFSNLQVIDMSSPTPYRGDNVPNLFYTMTTGDEKMTIIPERNSLDGLFYEFTNYDRKARKMYFGLQVDGGDLYGVNKKSSYFHTLTPKLILPKEISDCKEYIKSVNLYVSRPIDKIDWDKFDLKVYKTDTRENIEVNIAAGQDVHQLFSDGGNDWKCVLYPKAPIRKLADCKDELHKELLFLQKQWSVDEVISSDFCVSYECEFGSSEGSLGKTLEVDAWTTKRAGSMFVYNNRIHMFDSRAIVSVPDTNLQGLNGYENEYYNRFNIVNPSGKPIAYYALANSYDELSQCYPADLSDILEVALLRGGKGYYLGVYEDTSGEGRPVHYSAYTWYRIEGPLSTFVNSITGIKLYYASSSSGYRYMFFSEDARSYISAKGWLSFLLIAQGAKYVAIHDKDTIGSHPENLDWKGVAGGENAWGAIHKTRLCTVIAYLKHEQQTLVLRHENIPILFRYNFVYETMEDIAELSGFLTYPDSRCERLVIQYQKGSSYYRWETAMSSEKSSYNFSYAYIQGNGQQFTINKEDTEQIRNKYDEPDILNVTMLNNPTVFNVANSYRFKGTITGLSLALEELNTTQTGAYPLYVLTTAGVFALQQGHNNAILYSNINPINTDNCEKGKHVQVRSGVAYIANSRLYLLQGRNKVDILMPLDGEPDKAPRNNNSFTLACENDKLYNIQPYLCKEHINTYIKNAKLIYDSYHNEIILSHNQHEFSFVFNIDAKKWFKITGNYTSIGNGNIIAKTENNISGEHAQGNITITLLATEKGITLYDYNYVAIQSQPITINNNFANPDDIITLSHNNETIATLKTQSQATLQATLSLLTKNLQWIEADVNNINEQNLTTKLYVKSNKINPVEKIIISNNNSGEKIIYNIQTNPIQQITTNDKLINATLILSLKHPTKQNKNITIAQKNITENETIQSLNQWIKNQINNNPKLIAISNKNTTIIKTKNLTDEFNELVPTITILPTNNGWINQQAFINYTASKITNGITPITNKNVKLIKITNEINNTNTLFHIQTRPQKITPLTFSVLYKMLIRIKASLNNKQNISSYILASNNLIDYKCVAAQQRTNCNIDRIKHERIAHSFKYFILILGGITDSNTEISTIITQNKPNANKHIR